MAKTLASIGFRFTVEDMRDFYAKALENEQAAGLPPEQCRANAYSAAYTAFRPRGDNWLSGAIRREFMVLLLEATSLKNPLDFGTL